MPETKIISKERFEEYIDAIWEHKTKQEEEIKILKKKIKYLEEKLSTSLSPSNH